MDEAYLSKQGWRFQEIKSFDILCKVVRREEAARREAEDAAGFKLKTFNKKIDLENGKYI